MAKPEAFIFVLSKLLNSSIKDLRQQSYVLATIKHEVGNTFEPITEQGSEIYLKEKPYYPFIGRGYVQLTHKENYQRFGNLLNIDLVSNPELANNPEIAWKILEIGMSKGLFTGKKLNDYFNDKTTDWFNARRIINGLDRAEKIASYARQYYEILKELINA